MTSQETICLLRAGRTLDFASYVERTFQTAESAYRWRNRQSRNVRIVVLNGRHKVGDRIDIQTPKRTLR